MRQRRTRSSYRSQDRPQSRIRGLALDENGALPAFRAPGRPSGEWADSTARRDAEEDDNGPVQSDDVGVGQLADAVTKS